MYSPSGYSYLLDSHIFNVVFAFQFQLTIVSKHIFSLCVLNQQYAFALQFHQIVAFSIFIPIIRGIFPFQSYAIVHSISNFFHSFNSICIHMSILILVVFFKKL